MGGKERFPGSQGAHEGLPVTLTPPPSKQLAAIHFPISTSHLPASQIALAENAGRGMGRGLMALTGLKEGDLIIRAPMKWVMSSENAREHEDLAEALKLAKDVIPRGMDGEKITVALMLMYEACKQVKELCYLSGLGEEPLQHGLECHIPRVHPCNTPLRTSL